jgi:1-deoxyxylulose-5-phosphate synthase
MTGSPPRVVGAAELRDRALPLNALGRGGPRVSRLALGCNNFGFAIDQAEASRLVAAALDMGVNFFDTADVYADGGSERMLGIALHDRRDQAVIATKFGGGRFGPVSNDSPPPGRAGNVRRSLDASLRRLQVDAIDLWYLHRPDPRTPADETFGVMTEAVKAGKVRWLGCSNVTVDELRRLVDLEQRAAIVGPVAVQNHFSLLERDAELDVIPFACGATKGFVPYFPLASGILAGNYRPGEDPPRGSRLARLKTTVPDSTFDHVAHLGQIASRYGRTLRELAIAALTSREDIASVVVGARNPAQLRANVEASAWRLTSDELADIPRITSAGFRLPGQAGSHDPREKR